MDHTFLELRRLRCKPSLVETCNIFLCDTSSASKLFQKLLEPEITKPSSELVIVFKLLLRLRLARNAQLEHGR